jgi:hypothetical protein
VPIGTNDDDLNDETHEIGTTTGLENVAGTVTNDGT